MTLKYLAVLLSIFYSVTSCNQAKAYVTKPVDIDHQVVNEFAVTDDKDYGKGTIILKVEYSGGSTNGGTKI